MDTPALFVSRESHLLSYRSAIESFQKYAKAAEIEATIHRLRHTFATLSLEAGTDIRYLQEMLIHASITNTRIYIKVNSTNLHQEFDKAQKTLSLE